MIKTESQFYKELANTPAPPQDTLEKIFKAVKHKKRTLKWIYAWAAILTVTVVIWQPWKNEYRVNDNNHYGEIAEELQNYREYFQENIIAEELSYYSVEIPVF